jgi:hypothetical protein
MNLLCERGFDGNILTIQIMGIRMVRESAICIINT